jgi:hypothetical protein
VHLDTASGKKTREPESVPPSLMGQDHPRDLPARRRAPGLQTLDKRNQPLPASVQGGGWALKGDFGRLNGSRLAQILKHLLGHSRADPAGVNELALISIIAEQQRHEVRPRAFRIGPSNDNEFLPVEAFRLAPQAAIAGRIRASAFFDTTPSKPSLQACRRINSPSPIS